MPKKTADGTETYTVGTLTYNRSSLFAVMGMVLFGVFVYAFSVGFVPRIIPLRLKELGCSNTLLIFIMSTFGQILNMTVCPWVSFKSDRFRSKRWGRRFPFIFFTMPMMCAAWLLFAFVDAEGAFLSKVLSPWFEIHPATMIIALLAIIMLIYNFFLMFVGSVIYYVYNDVIPVQFMTRFMGAVQVVTVLANTLFNFFIFEHALDHFRSILIGISVLYALGITVMCLGVKEPRFPDPDPEEKRKSQGIRGMFTFIRESFSHRFYWYSFGSKASMFISGTCGVFMVFYQQSMGLSLADIGQLAGWSGIIGTITTSAVAILGTPFIDRWHPVRVMIFCFMFELAASLLGCKWLLFSPPERVYFWGSLLLSQALLMVRFRSISSMPTLMLLFPKSRFGQFCSAQSLFRSLMVLTFSLLLGMLMDFLKETLELGEYAYRFILLWMLFFNSLALIFYLLMYREFIRLGGYHGYHAPAPWAPGGLEKMPVPKCVPTSYKLVKYSGWTVFAVMVLAAGWTCAMIGYAHSHGLSEAARVYQFRALPLNIVLIVGYWFWRRHIISGKTALPHHSILILNAIVTVLLLPAFAIENFLALKLASGTLAPWMWFYEMCVYGAILLMLIFYSRFENYSSKVIFTPPDELAGATGQDV